MKFTIKKDELFKPLQFVNGAVEKRSNIQVLANVLLVVEDEILILSGTDIEIELIGKVAVTDTIPGRTTVPAKKFLDICRSLPDNSLIKVEEKNGKVNISSGGGRYSLTTIPADNFPIREPLVAKVEFEVMQSVLKSLIECTQFSMATNDVRQTLNGLFVETKGNIIRAVATDGHRLAVSFRSVGADLAEAQIVIPRKAVTELLKLLSSDSIIMAKVSIAENALRIATEDSIFTSKLVEGRYPDYERVLPRDGNKELLASRDSLKNALNRASILSNEKFKGIRMLLSHNILKLLAKNAESEEAEEILSVFYESEELEVAFNISYVLDVLNNLTTEEVKFTLSDSDSSVLIENSEENSMYVVMPMKL